MRESSFILPLADNEKRPVEAAPNLAASSLLKAFGGFSSAVLDGAWRDEASGVEYADASREYRVAADWTPALESTLTDIATRAGAAARQHAVYVRYASGDVRIVDVRPCIARQVNA